jgi:outer membrane usher protein
MTVPLTFQNRTLGEIPLRLTADDRFLLESETFIRLMKSILNDPAHVELTNKLSSLTQFGEEDLDQTGVRLTYDPSTLAVVVVEVSPEQRAISNLFAPPRDDTNDISLEPASLSGYLNLSVLGTYIWEGSQLDPPTINFDGAVRLGPVVFEGDAQLGQTGL